MAIKEPIEFKMRPMEQKDIPVGMRLKEIAKWNQLEQDWQLFLESSQTGSLVAEYEGKIVGTVTSVNYGKRFSWLGMLLVDPSIRRMGLGTKLLTEAMRLSADYGTIRLDATPAGKLVYDTLGYKDEFYLSRYEIEKCDIISLPEPEQRCYKMTQNDIEQVIDFDQEIFGAPRPKILKALFSMEPSYAWVLRSGDHLTGYCLGRPGSNFEQIGPIVAYDFDAASCLLLHALKECDGEAVILDIPDDQKDFRSLVDKIGFSIQRPFIRMYHGEHPYPGFPEYQYTIAGPEIG
jgi:ribosomal protein S18 acetylase RimI-like enzyme